MLVREPYTHLVNGCGALVTAWQLNLHRNTLTYHVESVEKVLGQNCSLVP